MELNSLLCVDLESMSKSQARIVIDDAIALLAGGGINGADQSRLKSILVAAKEIATGRNVGDRQDSLRADVLQKIEEAEARGDKRTARYLRESMGRSDIAAADVRDRNPTETVRKFIEDDIAAADALRKEKQDELVRTRTQELWHAYGHSVTEEQAREMAVLEIVGRPAYEDDVDEVVEKPDRQAILDAHTTGR